MYFLFRFNQGWQKHSMYVTPIPCWVSGSHFQIISGFLLPRLEANTVRLNSVLQVVSTQRMVQATSLSPGSLLQKQILGPHLLPELLNKICLLITSLAISRANWDALLQPVTAIVTVGIPNKSNLFGISGLNFPIFFCVCVSFELTSGEME